MSTSCRDLIQFLFSIMEISFKTNPQRRIYAAYRQKHSLIRVENTQGWKHATYTLRVKPSDMSYVAIKWNEWTWTFGSSVRKLVWCSLFVLAIAVSIIVIFFALNRETRAGSQRRCGWQQGLWLLSSKRLFWKGFYSGWPSSSAKLVPSDQIKHRDTSS